MKSHASGGSCTGTVTVDMLYWRDNAGNTIAETDGSGNTSNSSYNEYIFFAGRRIAQSYPFNNNVYYYFVDHLGSTRGVTDNSGNTCYEVDYLPYGTENTPANFTSNCTSPPLFRYRFTGYERDPETAHGNSAGNDYAFARYYNSRFGRFMSGDPLGGNNSDPQTLNRYSYVRSNPANLSDPSGANLRAPNGYYAPLTLSNCTIDGADFFCGGFLELGWLVACPGNDCTGVTQSNLPVQFKANMEGSFYSCTLTGEWATQVAAGTAAVGCTNDQSIATNTELSGALYKMSNGKYSWVPPDEGGTSSSPFDPTAIPDRTTYAGFYHDHGAFDRNYDSEQFSEMGCNGGQLCDIGLALSPGNHGQPFFLGTPGGRIEMFNPAQVDTMPFGCVLVGSGLSAMPGTGTSSVAVPSCQ